MKSSAAVWVVGACLVGCGGTFSGGDDSRGGGGLGAGGSGATAGGSGGGAGAGQAGAGGVAQGGQGNGGQAGAGATSGAGGFSGACNFIDLAAPAEPVRFLLHTNTPVYIKQDCTLEYELTSQCTGKTPLTDRAICVADCSDTSPGCVACGACLSSAKEVTESAPQEIDWSGKVYQFGKAANGCSCATGHAAPPGRYTFSIDAYFSAEDAIAGAHPYHHEVSFTLPSSTGYVTIELGFMGI